MVDKSSGGESKKGWVDIICSDAKWSSGLARELVDELRSAGYRANLREASNLGDAWSVASPSVEEVDAVGGLSARVKAFAADGARHVWLDDGSSKSEKLGSALMVADVNAMRVTSSPGGARRIGAMLGALDWDAGEPSPPVGDSCALEITSLGPMGFGSVSLRATIPAAALAAWESRRGRNPGSCSLEFAALVGRIAREKQWRPEAARIAGPGISTLRLTPLGDCPLPPNAKVDGSTALAQCVREAGDAMGLRPKVGR
jgi:hypothetical protein